MGVSAQQNFEWDVAGECTKTKEQLYSDSKIFVAIAFKSAQNVIQNDDKDGGNIIVKGIVPAKIVNKFGYTHEYLYRCTITLMFKENKFRIKVNNVSCELAPTYTFQGQISNLPCVPMFEGTNAPLKGAAKQQIKLRDNLRQSIQDFVNFYVASMKSEVNSSTEEW
jgi:hypothetical protein